MAKRSGGKERYSLQDHRRALDSLAPDLPFLTVIHGDNEFLRAEAVARCRRVWQDRHPDGDVAILRVSGEARPATLADITAEISGGSLFSGEKLVLVRQAEKILFPPSRSGDDSGKGMGREQAFLDRLAAPSATTWLILDTSGLPRNRTLGKRLAEMGTVVPCPEPAPREVGAWLSARAGAVGKGLTGEAADLLCRAHGSDLGALAGEVEKLALFADGAATIDAAMVREFLIGTIEYDIFGFTNAIEARDRPGAVRYARRITSQGARDQKGKLEDGSKSAHRILAMLAGTVQGLLRARVAAARGWGAAEFAAAEGLSPWRAEKLLAAAAGFSGRELRYMVRFVADQLRRVHDTGADPLLSLELLAVRLTGPVSS